jgi:hypothetical protein
MIWEGAAMRTFLTAATMLALATPAGAATRNFGVTSFEKIRIDGPYRINLSTGVAPFAKASGSPAALDRVAIEVRGDTLVVHSNSSWGGYPGADPGPIEIAIGTHDLSSAWINGSGSLSIDKVKGLNFALSMQGSGAGEIGNAAVDQLNLNVLGTASLKIAGHAGKLVVLVRGVSSLDAASLSTPNADISAEGTATVAATVTDIARVNAWGPATIRLTGKPACTLKVQGSATVTGCK